MRQVLFSHQFPRQLIAKWSARQTPFYEKRRRYHHMKRITLSLLMVCMIFASIQFTAVPVELVLNDIDVQNDLKDLGITSADSGVTVSNNPYIVLELVGGDISNHGTDWSTLLDTMGIANSVLQTSAVLADPSLIHDVPAIIIDGSLGSSNGNQVSQNIVDLLIREDIPLILTGRSACLLHRLSARSPPSQTAPVATTLATAPGYAGAVFLTQPVPLTIGSTLSNEAGLFLPVDTVQTEMSRLVNLTGSSISTAAPLRHDSWPLEVFLFAYEDPTLLTSTGEGLLENTVAYCNAVRETATTTNLAALQASEGEMLAGGFSYDHAPLIVSVYYAVHSASDLLDSSS